MGFMEHLPERVAQLLQTQSVTHYGSVSAAGVPIDTPLMLFPSADLTTLDMATGLSYPTKAERARKNPKVGMLIEGGPDAPVVSIAGMAAVRDADLQANMVRYYAETMLMPIENPPPDYATVIRPAVWYYSRILVLVTPAHIRWWDNPAAMDGAPKEWRAPADTVYPTSDPAPSGKPSEPAAWAQPTWQELGQTAIDRGVAGHLTLLDSEGFPIPLKAENIRLVDEGFRVTVPKGAPWTSGKASLSYEGREMFIGDAAPDGADMLLTVQRALPVFPLAVDPSEILHPKPETRAQLMGRLEHEAQRRGQPVPTMPAQPPEPTAGGRKRLEDAMAFVAQHVS